MSRYREMADVTRSIPALVPHDESGVQFLCYGDSCSGVPGSPHETNFAAVNAVVRRLRPQPQFICFLGDEISGLTTDGVSLLRQWEYWLGQEMAWLDRQSVPLYHTTGNHTTYDTASEAAFRHVLQHLPRNGPPGQVGLAYSVRRQHLLMIFVNTTFSGLGGEGRVETEWLERTLESHADAHFKLVFGHHPVFPVNGFSGQYQREIAMDNGQEVWRLLVKHHVMAYLCSHMLAFDAQVHDGVLQILTAGAGTAHLMPEGIEYLHCVQAALDEGGLRYQVLDTTGTVREWLSWPLLLPPSQSWMEFAPDESKSHLHHDTVGLETSAHFIVWNFAGQAASSDFGAPQTLLNGWRVEAEDAIRPTWIGLEGHEQRLVVQLNQAPGRSPHHWLGPELQAGATFSVQVAVHSGMGPGGVLWRWNDEWPWSSLKAASAWGPERVRWPNRWGIGKGQRGVNDQPFRGNDLRVTCHQQMLLRSQ